MSSVIRVPGRLRLLRALALAAALLAVPLAARAAACEQETTTPFAPWGDAAAYVLVPDGGFENGGEAWQLTAGAAIVDGNEPFHVGGEDDAHSLALPPGSSALSAPVCITAAHPTLRLFARSNGLLSLAMLSVVLSDGDEVIMELPVGVVTAWPTWQPSQPAPILVNLLAPLSPDGQLRARFRLAPLLGSLRIDDVYVDPWKTT